MNKPKKFRKHYHKIACCWVDGILNHNRVIMKIDASIQPYAVERWYHFKFD